MCLVSRGYWVVSAVLLAVLLASVSAPFLLPQAPTPSELAESGVAPTAEPVSLVGESLDVVGRVYLINYTVHVDSPCPNDPMAYQGVMPHTAFVWWWTDLSSGELFYSLSSGTLTGRNFWYDTASHSWVDHSVTFYFTTTTTTELLIYNRLTISGSTNNYFNWRIPTRTYYAGTVYRYRLFFSRQSVATSDYNLTVLLGVPHVNPRWVQNERKFYLNNNEVVLSPTYSLSFTPSSSDTPFTVQTIILTMTFTANDVGKSFDTFVVRSICTSCNPPWSGMEHIRLKLNAPFYVTNPGDALTIVVVVQLSSSL